MNLKSLPRGRKEAIKVKRTSREVTEGAQCQEVVKTHDVGSVSSLRGCQELTRICSAHE